MLQIGIFARVKVGILAPLLDGYDDKDYIVQGFSQGFDLGIDPGKTCTVSKPTHTCRKELLVKLEDEIEKGYLLGPFEHTPLDELITSPVCVVPKSNGKWRLIFNLSDPHGSSVNDAIFEDKRTVRYCSINDVAAYIIQHFPNSSPYLAKIDLKDAYRMVPIKKDQWKYLGMNVAGKYLIDRCLPMGAASSCQIFQRINDGFRWLMTSSSPTDVTIFNYLDDFLLLSADKISCTLATNHFLGLVEEIGLVISQDKVTFPTQDLIFLGIGLNTQTK